MVTREELDRLYNEAWDGTYDRDALIDIRDVRIDPDMPWAQRMQKYLHDIKNPYVYKCGDIIIREKHNPDGKTLDEAIRSYLTAMAEAHG
jgi:hypothetical protein